MGLFYHLFFPHERNNHRAKVLHNKSLLFIAVSFFLLAIFANFTYTKRPDILGISYSISETEMLAKINVLREKKNLPSLTLNTQLANAAKAKANDMFTKNYWAHFAPDGSTTPWSFIKGSGYGYVYAGENLAKGFTTSEDIIAAWMDSPSHRDNILSPRYRDIGFAIIEGDLLGEETVLVVEMFGSKVATTNVKSNQTNTALLKPEQEDSVKGLAEVPDIEKDQKIASDPRIDIQRYARNISFFALLGLLMVLFGDFFITSKKQIPRIVGHNIDHIMLISFFLLFVVLVQIGVIL